MKVEKSLLSFLYLNEIILHLYYIHVTKRLQKVKEVYFTNKTMI